MAAAHPKIEEITDDIEHDHAHEHDHEHDHEHEVADGSNVQVHSRNERKARQLIAKLKLKKVEGISRVFFRTNRQSMFVIHEPDVYKNPATGTYVVFGEAQMDNYQQNLANLQQQLGLSGAAGQAPGVAGDIPKDPASINADLEAAAANLSLGKGDEEEDDDAEVDAEGLDEGNIDLIVAQANTTRAKAIKALRKNKGDLVNAIMELTA